MRISDWSSDVCSSDLQHLGDDGRADRTEPLAVFPDLRLFQDVVPERRCLVQALLLRHLAVRAGRNLVWRERVGDTRSEEHTSELQSLMRISYADFCLKIQKTYTICYLKTNTQ